MDDGLQAQLARIEHAIDVALDERARALRTLRDVQDFANDEVDGAPDSKDPLKHVLAIIDGYACGEVPVATLHDRCKAQHRAAIDRAVQAEECERLLRMALARALFAMQDVDANAAADEPAMWQRLDDAIGEARDALRMPGRHAGPYLAEARS